MERALLFMSAYRLFSTLGFVSLSLYLIKGAPTNTAQFISGKVWKSLAWSPSTRALAARHMACSGIL